MTWRLVPGLVAFLMTGRQLDLLPAASRAAAITGGFLPWVVAGNAVLFWFWMTVAYSLNGGSAAFNLVMLLTWQGGNVVALVIYIGIVVRAVRAMRYANR